MTRPSRLALEKRILVAALASGAPAMVIALLLLYATSGGEGVRRDEAWSVSAVLVVSWLACAAWAHDTVGATLRTIANLVEAVRVRDFSIRAAQNGDQGALGELLVEVGSLAESLRNQKLEAAEAGALLQTVLGEVDVALFAFDEARRLRLVNAAGERLLGAPEADLFGRDAADIGADAWLEGDVPRVLGDRGKGGARWELRRATFRRQGLPHTLVVLTDVRRALRVEERQAWQRLVRVLSHEVNNSLAPIQSIAASQTTQLARTPRAADWEDDLRAGLEVVARRAGSLSRFLSAYARLARLPQPDLTPVDVGAWVLRVARLETRAPVVVEPGPTCTISGDADQLDAMLLNLVRNAAEAASVTNGGVRLRWSRAPGHVVMEVEDDGEGIADRANLFVPFFTTKTDGSGIGLVLSRQIAEAHDGELALEDRQGLVRGCVARVRLPVDPARA